MGQRVVVDGNKRCIINTPDRPLSPDEIVRGIFGVSLDALVKEIVINQDGKYDCLYSQTADRESQLDALGVMKDK